MIEVSININRRKTLVQIHAVRTDPLGCVVEPNTECTYDMKHGNKTLGELKHTGECGVDLVIAMLEFYKQNKEDIDKEVSLQRTIRIYQEIYRDTK